MPASSILLVSAMAAAGPVAKDFIDIRDVIPNIRTEIRYASEHNFIGTKIDGYEAPKCYLTRDTAQALRNVQESLRPFGLALKVFDCYRPQRAVDHFVRWARDLNDTRMKAVYYPNVSKNRLFEGGYIAARSGHSRGSTVDLTLVSAQDGTALDMGTPFDRFGPESWPNSLRVNASQRAHRMLLRQVMTRHGFRPLAEEWWHFTLENEPFPDRYFDFPIR